MTIREGQEFILMVMKNPKCEKWCPGRGRRKEMDALDVMSWGVDFLCRKEENVFFEHIIMSLWFLYLSLSCRSFECNDEKSQERMSERSHITFGTFFYHENGKKGKKRKEKKNEEERKWIFVTDRNRSVKRWFSLQAFDIFKDCINLSGFVKLKWIFIPFSNFFLSILSLFLCITLLSLPLLPFQELMSCCGRMNFWVKFPLQSKNCSLLKEREREIKEGEKDSVIELIHPVHQVLIIFVTPWLSLSLYTSHSFTPWLIFLTLTFIWFADFSVYIIIHICLWRGRQQFDSFSTTELEVRRKSSSYQIRGGKKGGRENSEGGRLEQIFSASLSWHLSLFLSHCLPMIFLSLSKLLLLIHWPAIEQEKEKERRHRKREKKDRDWHQLVKWCDSLKMPVPWFCVTEKNSSIQKL